MCCRRRGEPSYGTLTGRRAGRGGRRLVVMVLRAAARVHGGPVARKATTARQRLETLAVLPALAITACGRRRPNGCARHVGGGGGDGCGLMARTTHRRRQIMA